MLAAYFFIKSIIKPESQILASLVQRQAEELDVCINYRSYVPQSELAEVAFFTYILFGFFFSFLFFFCFFPFSVFLTLSEQNEGH